MTMRGAWARARAAGAREWDVPTVAQTPELCAAIEGTIDEGRELAGPKPVRLEDLE